MVGFEKTKQEVKKWNGIISYNRTAEKIYFPLKQLSSQVEPTKQFVKKFKLQSNLEKQLAALEPEPEIVEEKEDKVSMTLEEILERRKEAARMRALQVNNYLFNCINLGIEYIILIVTEINFMLFYFFKFLFLVLQRSKSI